MLAIVNTSQEPKYSVESAATLTLVSLGATEPRLSRFLFNLTGHTLLSYRIAKKNANAKSDQYDKRYYDEA